MKKVREPFAFVMEPDGSVGIHAYPSASGGKDPWYHVGHVRCAEDGSIISSPTFEESQEYGEWSSHQSVDEAVFSLLESAMERGGNDERCISSLKRSASVATQYSYRVTEALARSARLALISSVKNMLRVSTHDEVMRTVSEALVGSVMDG